MSNEWCWSCHGDWNVIIEPVSDWLIKKSKDPLVNSVWSCCITDMDAVSNILASLQIKAPKMK